MDTEPEYPYGYSCYQDQDRRVLNDPGACITLLLRGKEKALGSPPQLGQLVHGDNSSGETPSTATEQQPPVAPLDPPVPLKACSCTVRAHVFLLSALPSTQPSNHGRMWPSGRGAPTVRTAPPSTTRSLRGRKVLVKAGARME